MTRSPAGPRTRSHPLGFRALSRAVSWHRRKLAVLAAVAAVLLGINAALPPEPPTVEVVRAAARLDGGAVLGARDLVLDRVPVSAVPEDFFEHLDLAVGQKLTAPIPKGQVLTQLSVISAGRNVRSGQVVAPLRLADGDLAALLKVGDAVDVVAADGEAAKAAVVARGVRVVGLPQPLEDSSLGGSANSSTGALVAGRGDQRHGDGAGPGCGDGDAQRCAALAAPGRLGLDSLTSVVWRNLVEQPTIRRRDRLARAHPGLRRARLVEAELGPEQPQRGAELREAQTDHQVRRNRIRPGLTIVQPVTDVCGKCLRSNLVLEPVRQGADRGRGLAAQPDQVPSGDGVGQSFMPTGPVAFVLRLRHGRILGARATVRGWTIRPIGSLLQWRTSRTPRGLGGSESE